MSEEKNIFVHYILPSIILVSGLLGNLLGYLVSTRSQKLSKYIPRFMYKCLFILDEFVLMQIVVNYLDYSFSQNLTDSSKYACKLFWYLNFSTNVAPTLILNFISLEKYLSIKYPKKSRLLRKRTTQIMFTAYALALNFLFYLPVLFFMDVKEQEYMNHTIARLADKCDFTSDNARMFINLFDLINTVLLPFFEMITISVLLIICMIKIRQRIATYLSTKTKSMNRNATFIISLVSMNFVYLLFTMPVSIISLNSFSGLAHETTQFMFYIIYAVNFYVFLATNSLFRSEAFKILFSLFY